jgi:hypothetical protein
MAAIATPGLSDLLTWPTEHLTYGATHWDAIAGRWYGAFTQVWQDSLSVDWQGSAAEALHVRTAGDRHKVSGLVDQLQQAAASARSGASDLDAARSRVRCAVEDARVAGFDVDEGLSVIDRTTGGSVALRAARRAQAETHAADIGQRARQLVTLDQQVAGRVTSALAGIGNVGFGQSPTSPASAKRSPEPKPNAVRLVGNHVKQGPPIGPESEPPGGWSADPLKRAAQRIAYGHAWKEHAEDFPGMTKDQLAEAIYEIFRRNSEEPGSLIVGRTQDGAPVLYDPKTNVMVIRDPNAPDDGTVYKPSMPDVEKYLQRKIPLRVVSIPPSELRDGPLPSLPAPHEPPMVGGGGRFGEGGGTTPVAPPDEPQPPMMGGGGRFRQVGAIASAVGLPDYS